MPMMRFVWIGLGTVAVIVSLVAISGTGRDAMMRISGATLQAVQRTFGIDVRTPNLEITLSTTTPPYMPVRAQTAAQKKKTATVSGISVPRKNVEAKKTTSVVSSSQSVIEERVASVASAPPQQCDFTATGSPHHRVLLNEIAWMGSAQSASHEWIELRNNAGVDVALAGWRLLNEDGDLAITFENGEKIAAGALFLMERANDDAVPAVPTEKIYSGSLANDGEWLRLLDPSCALADEVNAASGWKSLGGDNASKKTLERNVTSFDWHTSGATGGTPRVQNSNLAPSPPAIVLPPPTPMPPVSQNPTSSVPSSTTVLVRVLVSEILYDAVGSDTGKEFVELYNDGSADVTLKDWALQSNGSSLGKIGSKTEDKTVIKPGAYFLVGLNGYAGVPVADVVRSASLPNTAALVTLVDSSRTIIDSVSYNVSVAEGESLERDAWTSAQFHVQASPTPTNSGL